MSAPEPQPVDPSPLNERQEALVEQVRAGQVTENEPDTEAQLLTLARMGHLTATSNDQGGYEFTVSEQDQPQAEPQPAQPAEPQPETEPQPGQPVEQPQGVPSPDEPPAPPPPGSEPQPEG
jgi:hypothetical protein